MNEYIFTTF